ncbi:hypothetical protein D3C80_1456890 [compost metagenome]
MALDQPFGDSAGNFSQDLRADGGGHDVRFGDQRHRFFAAAVNRADIIHALNPRLLAHDVNLIAFAAVQQVQHALVNVGKGQFGVCVRQQLTDKATPDIPCTEM